MGKFLQERQKNVQVLLADLKACSRRPDLQRGKKLHVEAIECGHGSNIYVMSTLVRMYAKCRSMVDARRVFDAIQQPDTVSWTALLLGYAENGEGSVALDLFARMEASGITIDSITYVAALKACASLALDGGKKTFLERGRAIHSGVGSNLNLYVQNTLVDMYAKCGSMVDAHRVFYGLQRPSVVSWNALLLGYAENGEGLAALDFFSRMKASGCAADSITYVAALKACTSLARVEDASARKKYLERGREIHLEIGSNLNLYVQNSLIDMYAKYGSMVEAHRVFDSMQEPDVVSWNALLQGYAENGEGLAALDLFSKMKARGYVPSFVTYVAALKACTSLAVGSEKNTCLRRGREIHLESGSNLNRYVQCTLIDMYAKCGSMAEAHSVFDNMEKLDVVPWTALILGYVENGEGLAALDLFSRMKGSGCAPNYLTYVGALKACAVLAVNGDANGKTKYLERGRVIHSEIGSKLYHYVHSTLIDMYAKCGSMVEAHSVFDCMQKPDVVSWTALLLGYAENGQGLVALDLFSRMKASGCAPDSVTYIAALKACTSLGGKSNCLQRGREIHLEIGGSLNHHVQSILVDMYAKCGSMVEAHNVFDSMQKPDVLSWNALLRGYAENGEGRVALDLFSKMKVGGCAPNALTYAAALKACGSIDALALGRKMHLEIRDFTARVVTALVDFYGKCGSMLEAQVVFDRHPNARDITTWNALLAGYGRLGDSDSVFNLFETMQDEGFRPNAVTFLCILSCCSHAGLVEKAREYFEKMDVRYGVTPTVMHYNCMVDVLGRANLLNEAIGLLQRMPCNPNAITWMALLGACCKWKNVEVGRIAFQSLVRENEKMASCHVLMAHIYRSKSMWGRGKITTALCGIA